MNVAESGRFALRGISANKLRSALTTLGILIGVAAVIVLVAVGKGSGAAVQNSISQLGSNTITVSASQGGTGSRGGAGGRAGGFGGFGGGATSGSSNVSSGTQTQLLTLTLDDAEALNVKKSAPDIESVAPVVTASSVTGTYDGATATVSSFIGTSPSYLLNDNDTVQYGDPFTDADYTAHSRVAILGATVAQDLVGGTGADAVGKVVLFNGVQYTVDGVLKAKGTTSGSTQDELVIAPLTTVQDTLAGYGTLSSISVKATSASTVSAAEAEVTSILDTRHKISASSSSTFTVSSATSALSAATSSNHTFTVLLASVAAISLLVGGIGVMNIMLVTVTERTREIGIRKAIGAGKGDIVSQFLFEAVLLSLFGAVTGVIAGLIGSRFTIVGVHPVVAPYSVGLAFGVALAVGLFFGLYPANRAASLRPIDALRYE